MPDKDQATRNLFYTERIQILLYPAYIFLKFRRLRREGHDVHFGAFDVVILLPGLLKLTFETFVNDVLAVTGELLPFHKLEVFDHRGEVTYGEIGVFSDRVVFRRCVGYGDVNVFQEGVCGGILGCQEGTVIFRTVFFGFPAVGNVYGIGEAGQGVSWAGLSPESQETKDDE